RRAEVAIRMALGASVARLGWAAASESLILGTASALVALATARWGVSALGWLIPPGIGDAAALTLGLPMSIATLLAAGATMIAAGAGSLAIVAASARAIGLTHPGARVTGAGGRRIRFVLLASEIAMALVLVTCAGLMLATLARLTRVDTGFDTDHVLTARMS